MINSMSHVHEKDSQLNFTKLEKILNNHNNSLVLGDIVLAKRENSRQHPITRIKYNSLPIY